MRRLLALSIDLDALELYLGLYGLERDVRLSDRARQAIPARAAERFGELCARFDAKGTLFVVGRDLAQGHAHDEIRALAAAGHEIGSHSYAHDYALTRRAPDDIDRDLALAEEEIERVTGRRPVGFRAPGYTLTPALQRALVGRGYRYDSSLLASPPYYAAKAAVISALRLMGRESRSILGPVAQLVRPRTPHRDAEGLLELPVSVLPGVRVPYIGTLVVGMPPRVSGVLARALAGDELVVLELHGVDLCDASDGVPPELLARQRELRVPVREKWRRLEAAIGALLQGREPVTLEQAARLVRAAAHE